MQGDSQDALVAELKRINLELLAEEGITQELIDFVDLDIEFSPVIAIRGEKEHQAVDVYPSVKSGYYIVNHPMVQGAVTEESLKVMRLRFLLEVKKNQRSNFRLWW